MFLGFHLYKLSKNHHDEWLQVAPQLNPNCNSFEPWIGKYEIEPESYFHTPALNKVLNEPLALKAQAINIRAMMLSNGQLVQVSFFMGRTPNSI